MSDMSDLLEDTVPKIHVGDIVLIRQPGRLNPKDGGKTVGSPGFEHGFLAQVIELGYDKGDPVALSAGRKPSTPPIWLGEIIVFVESAKGKKDWDIHKDYRRLGSNEWEFVECPH